MVYIALIVPYQKAQLESSHFGSWAPREKRSQRVGRYYKVMQAFATVTPCLKAIRGREVGYPSLCKPPQRDSRQKEEMPVIPSSGALWRFGFRFFLSASVRKAACRLSGNG